MEVVVRDLAVDVCGSQNLEEDLEISWVQCGRMIGP
jgi:hypothetical protein